MEGEVLCKVYVKQTSRFVVPICSLREDSWPPMHVFRSGPISPALKYYLQIIENNISNDISSLWVWRKKTVVLQHRWNCKFAFLLVYIWKGRASNFSENSFPVESNLESRDTDYISIHNMIWWNAFLYNFTVYSQN